MSASRLQTWFPWTAWPVICNGPMLGAACPALAAEVSKAGGLGFLASVFDVSRDSAQLRKLDDELAESRRLLGGGGIDIDVGVGVSFITGHGSIGLFSETALPVIAKHRPAAVWLFAPDAAAAPHRAVMRALGSLGAGGGAARRPCVVVQVGNVAAAREAVDDGADVVVCQGIDAGGHQFRRGAGVVSLVPEVRRMLDTEYAGRAIGLLAAGGVVDHRGVAAMVALEADGVVMGTRFTVARESVYPDHRKRLVLETVDGARSTLKSSFNDEVKNNTLWGPLYDGRAITGAIHDKFMSGASLDECRRSLAEDYTPEEATRMMGTWAGTGVGLVTKEGQPAAEIVREVREGAKEHIRTLAGLLQQ